MTFDLSSELAERQGRARSLATTLLVPAARDIDAHGALPASAKSALEELELRTAAPPALVLMVEEIAAASPTAAALTALEPGASMDLAGLRGVPRVETPAERHYLTMAAVCLGIGRAALDEALQAARARGDRPAGDPADPPHWALADSATEIDGARLLVHAAAAGGGGGAAAAFVHAANAATRAVDAALRLVGPEGFGPGSVLERAARDVRSVWLVLGSEDLARRVAADALLT